MILVCPVSATLTTMPIRVQVQLCGRRGFVQISAWCQRGLPLLRDLPNLSISQPHSWQVQPPQRN